MSWDVGRLLRRRGSLAGATTSLDWSLVALVAGFVLVAPIGLLAGNVGSPFLWLYRWLVPDQIATYEKSLAAAALKRPDYQKKLATIDDDMVKVINFRRPRSLPLEKRTFDMWVALADEVREACSGASDPVRKLQQVLGLPPVAAPENVLTELEVPRTALFRPCIGRSDVSKSTCEFELPDPPAEGADAATVREAYDRLRFGTKQMWDTYRTGFRREAGSPPDYPYTGYPFTGMGWTYDWGNAARGHFGVTEFIVKRDAVIKIVGENSPAAFCARPDPAKPN